MVGSQSGSADEGLGSLARWAWSLLRWLQHAVGPVAAAVLWAALAFHLYVSYLTDSLLLFPLAAMLELWSYGVYALVAWRLRVGWPKWYLGPVLVSGLAFLASDAFFAHIALHGGGGSTEAVAFAVAPAVEVALILPVGLVWGAALQAGCRAVAKALLRSVGAKSSDG
jgi:hypothetical protein